MAAYTASTVEQYSADIGTTEYPNADIIKIQLLQEIRDALRSMAKAQSVTVVQEPLQAAKAEAPTEPPAGG